MCSRLYFEYESFITNFLSLYIKSEMFVVVVPSLSQHCILGNKGFIKQHCVTDSGFLGQFSFLLFCPSEQPTKKERRWETKHFMGMDSLLKLCSISFPLSLNRFKNIEEKKNTGLSYPHP